MGVILVNLNADVAKVRLQRKQNADSGSGGEKRKNGENHLLELLQIACVMGDRIKGCKQCDGSCGDDPLLLLGKPKLLHRSLRSFTAAVLSPAFCRASSAGLEPPTSAKRRSSRMKDVELLGNVDSRPARPSELG
jgi:hypothetical protein